MSDTFEPMPRELEPIHRELQDDSATWSARLPDDARLRTHARRLASGEDAARADPARTVILYLCDGHIVRVDFQASPGGA